MYTSKPVNCRTVEGGPHIYHARYDTDGERQTYVCDVCVFCGSVVERKEHQPEEQNHATP
jgi:hypothetical protein